MTLCLRYPSLILFYLFLKTLQNLFVSINQIIIIQLIGKLAPINNPQIHINIPLIAPKPITNIQNSGTYLANLNTG